jgi:hypothetical protein
VSPSAGRGRDRGAPIFLSRGAFTSHARERLGELGVPQLEKPVTASELRACVKQVATSAHA